MIRFIFVLSLALISGALADDVVHPDGAQTGNYTTTFTQRSPLSSLKTMTTRMHLDKTAKDYDGSSEKFTVQVPDNYTPDKPMGLIVQLIFKDKTEYLNPECTKLLFDKNIAFVSRLSGNGDPVAKAGEALDAVYFMQQHYKIDPTRTYLFYFTPNENQQEIVGLELFTGYPDVFSGAMLNNTAKFWAPMRASNGGIYPAAVLPPPPQYRTAGAKHPLVLSFLSNDMAYATLVAHAWTSQGYKSVKPEITVVDDTHYPNFKPEWLGGVVDYLDQHKPPATRPTTMTAAH